MLYMGFLLCQHAHALILIFWNFCIPWVVFFHSKITLIVIDELEQVRASSQPLPVKLPHAKQQAVQRNGSKHRRPLFPYPFPMATWPRTVTSAQLRPEITELNNSERASSHSNQQNPMEICDQWLQNPLFNVAVVLYTASTGQTVLGS